MEEKYVKRIIYVAQCNCTPEDPFRDIKTDNPPREIMCPRCHTWHTYTEESYVGQDKFNKK